jgi:hypothetical protein
MQLLSLGGAVDWKYSFRPEKKLARHTENSEYQEQLPSARS